MTMIADAAQATPSQPYGRTDTLPPIGVRSGSPEAAILRDLIYQRRLACIQAFSKPLKLAKLCRKLGTWGQDIEFPEDCKTVVHKIRQVIETQVANHLKEPVQVTFEPKQSGEYARWYWCGPAEIAPEISAAGFPLSPLNLGGELNGQVIREPFPLSLQQVAMYKQLSESQPQIFDPQFICRLDDEYVSKASQKMFDDDWKETNNSTGGDLWLRSRVYASTVEGWMFPLVERDPQTMKFMLGFNNVDQTYIAQESEVIGLAPEAGIDLYIDLDESLAKYPDQAPATIKNQGWISQQSMWAPNNQGMVPVQYRDQFRRPMVRKLVWWIRNQNMPVPMGEQEAIDAGRVFNFNPEFGQEFDDISQGQPTGQAEPFLESQPAQAQARLQYTLADNTPTGATLPNWPKKNITVIRQVTIISDEVVEDVPVTKWPDIPLLQLRNSMVIGRSWSIGEPFYCVNLQDMITDIATSGKDHVKYNANPSKEMIGSLYDWMEKEIGEAFVVPGKTLRVPNQEFKENPNGVVRTIMPPPFPESSLKLLDVANGLLDETSGRTKALSGNSPSSDASGELVKALQSGAVEPLNFKAQDIAFMMERVARFYLHAELHDTPLQRWSDVTDIPLPLVSLVVKRAIKRSPGVKITVSSGAGMVMEQKRDRALLLNKTISPDDGLPLLDGKSTRDIQGLDSSAVARRSLESMRDRMQTMAPTGIQPVDAQGQNGQHNGNGNGDSRVSGY